MKLKEAENYAESLVFARGAIRTALETEKINKKIARYEWAYKTKGDPTAAIITDDEIPAVRCICLGVPLLVYQPEKWLQAIDGAFGLIKQRWGEKSYQIVKHRFRLGWSPRRVCAQDEISMQTYALRRQQFLAGLLALACQAGLIKIDV